MKFVAVTAIAMLLAGCASAPSAMSYSERLVTELSARTAQACGSRTGKAYYDCASGVRNDFFARGQYARAGANFPNSDKNRGNNGMPTSSEPAAIN